MNLLKKRGWITGLAIFILAMGITCKRPQTVVVPNLIDNTVDVARVIVTESHLLLSVDGEVTSSTISKGRICKQSPMRGSKVEKWTAVRVWLSRGE